MAQQKPPYRKLRGYAFDPSLSLQMETSEVNDIIYIVDWEEPNDKPLDPGPIGEYVEVIDYDPSTGKIYKPIDLNNQYILATEGLTPSESNPQFHQQMVYAVTMTTIKNFESALGRQAMWSPRRIKVYDQTHPQMRSGYDPKYVQRLRIYPHALREANAFYSPQKKSLLFGYFAATPGDLTQHMPGSLVFTCLSHDIIAHETTHALLDGMHSGFTSPTNPDVLAFHEAFADLVALFQHFTFPEVLKHQIAKTKGNLESQNLLGQLAQQFGKAIGLYGSLRDAIGEVNTETKKWELKKADPLDYENFIEPHNRGSILVAAVFEAFLSIYKSRIADLLRIATGGTGILPDGELHPDLVNRLSIEASKSASHILRMCVRALDYCPTTDITFGDYLRAIITADVDLIENDSKDYRIAFIDAFRKRGIYPEGIKTLSVESLIYKARNIPTLQSQFDILGKFLREFREKIYYERNREKIFNVTKAFIAGGNIDGKDIVGLHERITDKFEGSFDFEKLTGLYLMTHPQKDWERLGIRSSDAHQFIAPSIRVTSLKLANRVGPQGKIINHIILTLTQRASLKISPKINDEFKFVPVVIENDNEVLDENIFTFRGSCTLIFDLDTLELKYAISKPLIDIDDLTKTYKKELNRSRIIKQYNYLFGESNKNEFNSYFSHSFDNSMNEPFAFLHRS